MDVPTFIPKVFTAPATRPPTTKSPTSAGIWETAPKGSLRIKSYAFCKGCFSNFGVNVPCFTDSNTPPMVSPMALPITVGWIFFFSLVIKLLISIPIFVIGDNAVSTLYFISPKTLIVFLSVICLPNIVCVTSGVSPCLEYP